MHRIAIAIASILSIFIASPASAQIVITQAKALAGSVTPGDTAGYPITLSQAGAYVLGSNLTVPSGLYGIYAGVDNIDIDLNGFTMSGGSGGTYALITYKGQGHIHGGVIKAFRSSGLFIRGDAWTIEDMKIVQNGGMGIDATGTSLTTLQNSLIAVNSNSGIVTGPISYFVKNRVVNNAGTGISCRASCQIESNIIDLNANRGIVIGSGLVIGNTITRNGSYAIEADFLTAGLSDNIFINNNKGSQQLIGTFEVNPYRCIGSVICDAN